FFLIFSLTIIRPTASIDSFAWCFFRSIAHRSSLIAHRSSLIAHRSSLHVDEMWPVHVLPCSAPRSPSGQLDAVFAGAPVAARPKKPLARRFLRTALGVIHS